MRRATTFSLLLLTATTYLYGWELNRAKKGVKSGGYIRLGLQQHDRDHSDTDLALGGKLKYAYIPFERLKIAAAFYMSQPLIEKKNVGIPFYGSDNRSITLLGEAFIKGGMQATTVKIGRQMLDTPFLDSDDNGMIPNLFEAGTVVSHRLPYTMLLLSHVTKWAGVDAPQPQRFTRINGNRGLQIAGAIYDGVHDTMLQGWYYHAADMDSIYYFAADHNGKYAWGRYELGVQYAFQDFKNKTDAAVGGISVEFSHARSGVSLSAAYNRTDSKGAVAADNFFGGGPFYAAAEHLTIAEAGIDGRGMLGGISLDGAAYGVEGLSVLLTHLRLKGDDAKANETDVVASWSPKENVAFDLIYSDVNNRLDNEESFENLRFFANYHF